MQIGRITAASCLGFICCTVLAFASQSKNRPSRAEEILRPLPKGGVVPDVVKSHFVPRRIERKLPDESVLQYRGISVKRDPLARGDALLVQNQLAAKLSQLDFVPSARIQHFQWMEKYPVKIVEWKAKIQSTNLTPNGVRARVFVQPVAVPTKGMYVAHRDYFIEDYFMDAEGTLEFVGFQDPGPHQGFLPL